METNPRAYKRGYKDSIKVSIAAPIGNMIAAFLGGILYVMFYKFAYFAVSDSVFYVIASMLFAILTTNVCLGIFNLLPLPGLAGFEIFRDIWPKTFYKVSDKIYQYQFLILILIIFAGGTILSIPVNLIYNFFYTIAKLIFGM